jgi:DNA end-binding protein Ku
MPRAIWKGSLAFGLVNIPVELHTAVRDNRPHFRLLHAKDKSPVRFERVCIRDGNPVAWEDVVKGYEISKGHFVVLTKDDFKAAAVEKTKTVDIIDFVDASEIDDRFFEVPYYLLPARGGERSYALLREAMRDSRRVGIAKFVLRDQQHLAAVEVMGEALVLTVMRFSDELADVGQFEFPRAEVRKQELAMARTLIGNLEAKWDPSKYTDQYRANLLKIIRARSKGQTTRLDAGEEKRSADVVDLMERLRQSLEGAGASNAGRGSRATRSARTRRSKSKRHQAA